VAERLTKKERREQTQAKVAAMRAAQARKERRARLIIAVSAVVAVLLVVGVLVVVKLSTNSTPAAAGPTGAAPAAVVQGVTGVPLATYNTVGAGTIQTPPAPMNGAEAITAAGKPRVLYVGAEYCPFCAAERWSMVAALSRFGTWSGLGSTSSSSTDVDPSTPTLSFHGATYTSKYLSFTGYEETTNKSDGKNGYTKLDTVSAADEALANKYDAAPYVDASSAGSIPFVDIGGKFVISGASYDPAVLKGKTHQQIATAMADPSSPIAKAIDGTANVLTAALCSLTQNKPADVCTSQGVELGTAKLVASGS
jgi:Domain of unknown function (DUF929)